MMSQSDERIASTQLTHDNAIILQQYMKPFEELFPFKKKTTSRERLTEDTCALTAQTYLIAPILYCH